MAVILKEISVENLLRKNPANQNRLIFLDDFFVVSPLFIPSLLYFDKAKKKNRDLVEERQEEKRRGKKIQKKNA